VKRLKSRTDLPSDWLPSGVNDPVIRQIFEGISFPLQQQRKTGGTTTGAG
jgi:hypothetical protein